MPDPTSGRTDPSGSVHIPVLLNEVLHFLDPQPGLVIVDGTIGGGGHARHILERIQPGGRLIGLDRDPMMLALARTALTDSDATLVHAGYADLRDVLDNLNISLVDRILVDLGLSSDQLADSGRGFSIDAGGPLDMRFDTSHGAPASELVNHLSESDLADLIFEYGEERYARRIARRIVERRPIDTAAALADAVCSALPHGRKWTRIHPATRTFQALRIAVNRELDQLDRLLHDALPRCLKPGGRAAVISFHSLEDRRVKQAFRDRAAWDNLTRKPVTAGDAEREHNPRSRSAKLRAAVRK